MSGAKEIKRVVERESTSIPVVIKGRENTDTFWKEITEIYSLSRLGAGFDLKRECPPGRILSLMMEMPKTHRCYDWEKKHYLVWAVVQYCEPIAREDFEGYRIGVAFVGKDVPKSYFKNPSKTYKIAGMDEDGFWNIGETKHPFIARSHPRFPYPVKVRLAHVDIEGEEIEIEEEALVKDICLGGAAVWSNLDVQIGDCVRFTYDDYEFDSLAIVRNRQLTEDNFATLHLSFSEAKFPIEVLPISGEATVENEEFKEFENLLK